MTRRTRILRNVGIGLAAFVMLVVVGGILVVRSEWFRNYLRQKVVAATEEGTGGRVQSGPFSFDWTHLRATITDFVIHGGEPAGSLPFVSVGRVVIQIRVLPSFKHPLDVTYLGVERPQVNILVFPDGTTNVPKPKQASTSKEPPLQSVVDLEVKYFTVSSGSVTVDLKKQDIDFRGEALHAQLWYDTLKQGYKGEISMSPLYVVSGRNTPLKFRVDLPVTLDANRIAFQGGRITTDQSQLLIEGSLRDLNHPVLSAHVQGRVALADLEDLTNPRLTLNTRGLPSWLNLDVNATVGGDEIDVADSRVTYGGSTIQASGKLQDPAGNGALQFQAQLDLAQLGRLAKQEMLPEGALALKGSAKLDAQGDYDVQSIVDGRGLSFQQGTQRIRYVTLSSQAHLTPHRLDLSDLRIGAFGADLTGSASLEDFARYKVDAKLNHLSLQTLMAEVGYKGVTYTGAVSGLVAAAGNLQAPGTESLTANARLSIVPGRQGIPVSGRLIAEYRGTTDNLSVSDSYIALPHTRVTMSGSLGNRLNVTAATADLRDLSPLTGGTLPIALAGGHASFTGGITGRLTSPEITGQLAIDHFAVEGRQFDSLTGDVAASSSRAAISNATLQRATMLTQFDGSVGLQNWNATQTQPLSVAASIHNGDLADVFALAGTSPAGYSGALSANVDISGTIANPRGAANLTVSNGTLDGQPFDRLQAQVNLADQLVTVPSAEVTAGPSAIHLTADFHHLRDHFDRGQIHAHVDTTQLDLARLRMVQNWRPDSAGILQGNADITGDLQANRSGAAEFVPTNVTADASGRGLRIEGQNYGDFTGAARANGRTVTYTVNSDFAGSQIRVSGNTQLTPGYQTVADATITALPIDRMLVLARRTDIPAKGTLSATVHFAGTADHPEASLDATVDRGVFYNEPIDHIQARVTYLPTSIDVTQLDIRAGDSRLEVTGRYDHPAGVLTTGDIQFRIANGNFDLAHIRELQKTEPGLAGTVQLTANGSATVRAAEPRTLAHDLNVNVSAKGIAARGKNLGDLTLAANTTNGRMDFSLDSDLAGATIQGKGNAQLSGDYPLTAQVTLQNLTWKGLQPLLGPPGIEGADFDAATDGKITVNGSALRPEAMNGRVELSRVQFTATAPEPDAQKVAIENQGPVAIALANGVARIESLHLTGPQTDVEAHGTVSLAAQTLEASVNAHTDLGLIQRFQRDVVSSGQVSTDVTVRGSFASPQINGKLQLQNASVADMNFPAGLSNAAGVVDFNGSSASFQNVTGVVGGGKVTLSGFVSYSQRVRMELRVNARKVRLLLQPGVGTVADADLRLGGRIDTSILSGTVTIDQVEYAPKSDIGAILSRAAPSIQSPATPSPLFDNMKLDVDVRTSAATSVQASMAQNLQVDANLRFQGTASQPGVVGRISINEGKLVFFNSSYTVNSGIISFYNPLRIDPILDLSLETHAKGVDVTLRVNGPIDNMKLSYTADPPISFQEIIGLLAMGQTPTSDPTLLANQPPQPQQSFQQMGESAIVGQALADPVANRLQRVFGITQLNIAPTFANNSALPTAQFSVQQQVTSRITLTYTTAVEEAGQTAVSGQFFLTRQWSAMAMRDQFGLFTFKLTYKKQFQ